MSYTLHALRSTLKMALFRNFSFFEPSFDSPLKSHNLLSALSFLYAPRYTLYAQNGFVFFHRGCAPLWRSAGLVLAMLLLVLPRLGVVTPPESAIPRHLPSGFPGYSEGEHEP